MARGKIKVFEQLKDPTRRRYISAFHVPEQKLRRVFILDCLLAEIVTVCGHKLCKGIYRIKLGKKQELFFSSLTSNHTVSPPPP
jgi:hypothetical protein